MPVEKRFNKDNANELGAGETFLSDFLCALSVIFFQITFFIFLLPQATTRSF